MPIKQLEATNKNPKQLPTNGDEPLFVVDRRLPVKDVVTGWKELNRQRTEQLMHIAFDVAMHARKVAGVVAEAVKASIVVAVVAISVTAYSISKEPHLSKSIDNVPIGISAAGISSHEGQPLPVITDRILGYLDIKEIGVSYDALGSNLNGFGLGTYKEIVGSGKGSFQLNAFLFGGQNYGQIYWAQNVVELDTKTNEIYFALNVWDGISTQPVLAYDTPAMNYTLPIKIDLSMSLKTFEGSEYLFFSYQINNEVSITYYKYKLPSTFLLISSGFTPTDLVFCGPYSSEIAYASKIDASLALYYDDNGKLLLFSNINTEDLSLIHTGESAANVNAYLGSDSFINLSTGNPTNINLTNFSPDVPK